MRHVAGCDGFHGVSRPSVPEGALSEHEYVYPFGWLGILAEAAPTTDELIYGWHERGFALYSMRSPWISRLYLQVPADERIEDWTDEAIWEELQTRLAAPGWRVGEGPVIDAASRRCGASSANRFATAGCSCSATPPTSCRRPAPRA